LAKLRARRLSELIRRFGRDSSYIGKKVTAFLVCARMKFKRCHVISIDRKNIIVAATFQNYWRDAKLMKMIG